MVSQKTNGWKMWVINSLFTVLLLVVMAGVGLIFAATEKNAERIDAAIEKATDRSDVVEDSYQHDVKSIHLLIAGLDKSDAVLIAEIRAIRADQARMLQKLDDIEERLR